MADIIYKIPLQYRAGEYRFKTISAVGTNYLELILNDYDILTYKVPKLDSVVNIYSVSYDTLRNDLWVVYDENQVLSQIVIRGKGKNTFIYLNLTKYDKAKDVFCDFAKTEGENMSKELLKSQTKAARLFVEYYYDGMAVDIAAKIGSESDKEAILEECGGNSSSIDNCGDYPFQNRIECNRTLVETFLLCARPKQRQDLFNLAVNTIIDVIKNTVIDKIDKTEDFKFIAKEYH